LEALNTASPNGGKPAPVSLDRMQVQIEGGVPGGVPGGVTGGVGGVALLQNVKLHPATSKSGEMMPAGF
jgi:hypothetical protein